MYKYLAWRRHGALPVWSTEPVLIHSKTNSSISGHVAPKNSLATPRLFLSTGVIITTANQIILDFKISPCGECFILSFEWFPGVWVFCARSFGTLWSIFIGRLTLILLTWRIVWAPSNANRWQMGFNLAFRGLNNNNTTNYHSYHGSAAF
jgi:hypothetical protein